MNYLIMFFVAFVFLGIAAVVFFAMIAKSYIKAPANKSFVRTGGLSKASIVQPKVVMNGGSWVFGLIHEVIWVDLRTMEIEIERTEDNALLTHDPQYADIKAIFYIKVNPTKEGIIDAARTIGDKVVDAEIVKHLMDAKLDGALRDVAATFTLMSLHQEREKFIEEVQTRVKEDLEENGLILESVSILTLRAARQGSFSTEDVFGAQVARANAEVIEEARSRRNDIERRTELAITTQNVHTSKETLKLEQDLAFATATQDREVRSRQALEKAEAEKATHEQEETAAQSRIAKERSLKLAELEMDRTLLVEEEHKNQEHQVAEIKRTQAIDVAAQAKQIAIFTEQQKREAAEKARLLAAAEREQAAQDVKTVEETAQAKREADIQIIEAKKDAERAMIERKNATEIEALKKVRDAEAQATALKKISEAELEAAQKQAETRRQQAQADSDAKKMLAAAERARGSASGLAEADVIRAKAEATQTEAEVLRAKGLAEAEAIQAKGLAEAEGQKAKAEALAAFDNVSQQLEMERLRIDAQIQIGVARAEAVGSAIANMQIKMFGTPEAADTILRLMSFADGMDDVIDSTPAPIRQLGSQLLNKVLQQPNNGHQNEKPSPALTDGHDVPEDMVDLIPQLLAIIDRTLDVDTLQNKSVSQVLEQLTAAVTDETDKVVVEQSRQALALLPIVAEMDFEDLYLRLGNTQVVA